MQSNKVLSDDISFHDTDRKSFDEVWSGSVRKF